MRGHYFSLVSIEQVRHGVLERPQAGDLLVVPARLLAHLSRPHVLAIAGADRGGHNVGPVVPVPFQGWAVDKLLGLEVQLVRHHQLVVGLGLGDFNAWNRK